MKKKVLKNIAYLSIEFMKNIPSKVICFAEHMEKSLQLTHIIGEINFIYEETKIAESQAPEDISRAARKIGIRMAKYCSSRDELIEYISKLLDDIYNLSEETTFPFSSYAENQHVQYTINFLEKIKKDSKIIDEITYYLTLSEESLEEFRNIEERKRLLSELKSLKQKK